MCLSRVFTDEEMEEWLADKPEVIEVGKCVIRRRRAECYSSMCWGGDLSSGFSHSRNNDFIIAECNTRYYAGFHFFADKEFTTALEKECYSYLNIKCYVKKKWITAIGEEAWAGDT